MNVFFDHQTFSQQLYGGISRYFCELITGINTTDEFNAHLSLLWSNNEHLRDYKIPTIPYPFPKKNRLLNKSNQLFNTIDYKLNNYDLYHATYFDDFLVDKIKKTPLITTFYDMTYERLSHQFKNLSEDTVVTAQKKKIAQKASHLIAISQSTKQDMVDILGISPDCISVIPLASSFFPDIPAATIENPLIEKPYLLYVGNRNGYKNFNLLLEAAAELLIKHDIYIICAGGGKFSNDELTQIDSLALNNLVKQTAIDDKILPSLYRKAIAFVFPSFYEGFGIPILEAFSCNCPCVLSNTSSLPEVAGDAAIYIDPSDRESIADALSQIINDDTLRSVLIQLGKQRLTLFSWQSTVEQTVKLYKKFV